MHRLRRGQGHQPVAHHARPVHRGPRVQLEGEAALSRVEAHAAFRGLALWRCGDDDDLRVLTRGGAVTGLLIILTSFARLNV